MYVKTLLLGLATAAMAHVVRERPFGCGTPEPTAEQLKTSSALAVQEKNKMTLFGAEPLPVLEIDTYFHVVSISEDPADGYLTVRRPIAAPVPLTPARIMSQITDAYWEIG